MVRSVVEREPFEEEDALEPPRSEWWRDEVKCCDMNSERLTQSPDSELSGMISARRESGSVTSSGATGGERDEVDTGGGCGGVDGA